MYIETLENKLYEQVWSGASNTCAKLTNDLGIQVNVCALESEVYMGCTSTFETTEGADTGDAAGDRLVCRYSASSISLEVEAGNIHTDAGKAYVCSSWSVSSGAEVSIKWIEFSSVGLLEHELELFQRNLFIALADAGFEICALTIANFCAKRSDFSCPVCSVEWVDHEGSCLSQEIALVGNFGGDCGLTILREPVAELVTVAWVPVTVAIAGPCVVVAVSLSAIPVGAPVGCIVVVEVGVA